MKAHKITATRDGDVVFVAQFEFDDDVDPADPVARDLPAINGTPDIIARFNAIGRRAAAGGLLLWHPMGDVGKIDPRRLRAFEAIQAAMARDLRWTLAFDIATQLPFAGDVPAGAVA